jgi:magnesium-transporting ATPase (P-type)
MEDLKTVEKRYLLQIIKTFEFNSSLQRMSVIVRSGQDLKIFCKGNKQAN